ncbi:antibiotic biosynthesis monooxygenase [Cnuibacter physcomitrellae]|uniref:Uncharacterized protein n=1 Tax=Cnuibacter physcomitrellae TaxID=1619308 RepID=A0A1X9LR74_9MICO|nr:putative quinol monooxygenase [Cnuibacter physcomitrellae]ARJ06828.1 hypothetical protein B5808_17575 [Cnuibacter physcomitrellae]GGI38932.1 antibiotic biosynthesis monooxygenase [Cnuibacter physcomitrellae]
MYTVFVRLQIALEKRDEFVAGIRANARASLADEPGCLRFDVHQDATDPTTFYFYEIYVDEAAFETAHRAAPHYARWREVVAACVVPGTQQNTYALPLFPGDIPENPTS